MVFTYQYFQPKADAEGRTVLLSFELDEDTISERLFQPVFRGAVGMWEKDGSAVASPPQIKDFYTIAEALFISHNADDRPRGQEIRSMSVGDVLLITANRIQEALQVDSMGFREVEVVEIDHTLRIIR